MGGFFRKRWVRITSLLLLAVLVFAIFLAWRIVAFSTRTSAGPADAAVVLGAAVWEDAPSPVFRERINHALRLYQEGRVRHIIFTGGRAEGDIRSEAETAKDYALAHGIPENRIHCETVSTTTVENLREAGRIIERNGFRSVLVVSDPLHMKRAIAIAADLGLSAEPSPTETTVFRGFSQKASFLVREVAFYAIYIVGLAQ